MNRFTAHIILFMLCTTALFGSVSVNRSGEATVDLQTITDSRLRFDVTIENIGMKTVTIGGKNYTALVLDDYRNYQTVGSPGLPVIRKAINLPAGATVDYDLEIHSTEVIDLAREGFPDILMPVQPFRKKNAINREDIEINEKIYQTDDYFALGPVETHPAINLGGLQGQLLDFFPISYHPVRHRLKIITHATISVSIIDKGTIRKASRVSPAVSPEIDRLARRLFVNYDQSQQLSPAASAQDFLVIIGDQFSDNSDLERYLNWKRQCGFNIITKTTSELGGTKTSIKEFIAGWYDMGNPLSYVLLIGDVADVPTWNGAYGEAESDAPYARMDGDYFPDLMIGRFSAADSTDLAALINKSLDYEQGNIDDLLPFNKTTFIATDDVDYWDLAEASHDYVIDTYLNNQGIYSNHIRGHSGGSTSDILQALNSGRSICHYSGHGIETEWQGPIFSRTDIDALNTGSPPVLVISNACLTGSYAWYECFGERWTRAVDKGAFAFIGASNSTYWEPDDIMERAMYDGFFSDGKTSIGNMLQSGLLDVYSQTISVNDTITYRYYFDVYNILGDPSIKPWMGIPRQTYGDYRSTIALNSRSYSITVMNDFGPVADAVVSLVQDGALITCGKTDVDGACILAIEVGLLAPGEIILTVSADQQIPLIDYLDVVNPVNVTISPAAIPVNVLSDVSVTLTDDSSVVMENVDIYARGWTLRNDTLLGTTDNSGMLTFRLKPQYGEALTIYGTAADRPGPVFIDSLHVSSTNVLINPGIAAGVSQFDIDGFLSPGYAGEITGFSDQADVFLAVRGCGLDTVSSQSELSVIPDTIGNVIAALLKTGYEVYETPIAVRNTTGTVQINVANLDGQALQNVSVFAYLLADTTDLQFSGQTDLEGVYNCPVSVKVGHYQFRSQRFGYRDQVVIDTVKTGTNIFTLEMTEAPRFAVSGDVTGGLEANPLAATLSVSEFSSGSAAFYTSISTNINSGGAYQLELPSGDYEFTAASPRYIAETVAVSIVDQAREVNFNLDTTLASILLIDDDSGKRAMDKMNHYLVDEKNGKGGCASSIRSVLEKLGYYVYKSSYMSSLDTILDEYDLLISSSGSNMSPLENAGYRMMLETYVAGGGALLISGGEVAYDATTEPGYPDFARDVLHVSAWIKDDGGSLYRLLPDHEITTVPHELPFQMEIDYSNYGDDDACTPTTDAEIVYFNGGSSSSAGIILYENPDYGNDGKTVFYTFAFDKISDTIARNYLLTNTVTYLLKESENAKGDLNKDRLINILDLTKVVNLILEIDTPANDYEIWAADLNSDNRIDVLDLVGVINIILGRDGLGKPIDPEESFIRLRQQQQDLVIDASMPLAALQINLKPGSTLDINAEFLPDNINIRRNNHTLLIYSLADDGICFKSLELGKLDHSGSLLSAIAVDVNGNPLKTDLSVIPDRYHLYQNYPNPFNAETTIRFDLPFESHIILEIYDLLGRRVITLADDVRQPGGYRIRWNGRDRYGRELATGIYFIALRVTDSAGNATGKFQQLRKLVLVK